MKTLFIIMVCTICLYITGCMTYDQAVELVGKVETVTANPDPNLVLLEKIETIEENIKHYDWQNYLGVLGALGLFGLKKRK